MRLPRSVRRISILAVVLTAVAGLGSCTTPPPPQFPELTFTHLPQIALGVARIEIVDNFTPPSDPKHVESRMPVSPEVALRNWARDRLQATGVSGVAKFIINNAAVTETELARKTGLSGVFTTEQSHRYDAGVDVEVRLEGVPRVTQAFAKAAVNRSQTIPEDASINVREETWFNLTEQVMKDFDPQMSASIRKHLADFIR
ncbi:MAG: hypothetical protein JJ900_14160 [Rhodospirillales bacterium]|nr:hypothetical protein [Rhodospirillales bacterium]MBO6787987.1 hypothetical protein [Rhodospirillales bacterium]